MSRGAALGRPDISKPRFFLRRKDVYADHWLRNHTFSMLRKCAKKHLGGDPSGASPPKTLPLYGKRGSAAPPLILPRSRGGHWSSPLIPPGSRGGHCPPAGDHWSPLQQDLILSTNNATPLYCRASVTACGVSRGTKIQPNRGQAALNIGRI